MKMATVIERAGKLILHPNARTTAGVWITSEPLMLLEASIDDEALGGAVQQLLRSSVTDVAHPKDWGALPSPLALVSAKSWNMFMKGAKCCQIEESGDELRFVPTANRRSEGFVDLLDEVIKATLHLSAQEIGEATRRALSVSTG